jgi:superfamily II DNA or RNA helicase
MELTEKFLVSLGGWPVFKEAKAIRDAGRIRDATYEPPLLKGRISEGGREFLTGLKIKNPVDIENLCPCRDSRQRGLICAHSIAAALEIIAPAPKRATPAQAPTAAATASTATSEAPRVEFSLEGSLRYLEGAISFHYSQPDTQNPMAEAAALARLVGCGFENEKGKAVLRGEDAVVKFYATELPRLKNEWSVQEGERFQHVTKDIVRFEPRFALKERSDGWLDFHVHFTAGKEAVLSAQDLQRLLQSGKPQLRLADGRIAVPDAALATDLEEVLRDCDPSQERGVYKLRECQRGYIESSIAEWTRQSAPLPQTPKPEALEPLREHLRPYQIEGALWLLNNARSGSAGLLADEMGLGKTIQTLAMVEALRGPHLVVCPSSLVWNWSREATAFCPSLRVLTLEGAGRSEQFAKIPEHDLIITSYALLRRDAEHYKAFVFSTTTLDEAQHIKNPGSQNARAACAIRSKARFILTGTPLENSIRDLWSLFDFLLPAYLGTRKDFQDRYEKPLAAGESAGVWPRLLRRVKPWMLRRTKSEILKELPPKIEQVVQIELSPDQKAAYTQLQIAARAEVDAMRESGGAARMKVLTALLRLRQACCDLRLLNGESQAPSAKIDALLELLSEAVDGGHRTLVFSQFTSMLDLIAPALDEAGISWCRLDGSTKDRAAVVERFQSDSSISVFLISLKAGGVGLNLTGADTVIHFDPWWNPAVEAQATDRAHRIGQKNVVTSIKLIARDTVEERVLEMQAKKKTLSMELLDPDSVTGLSADLVGELIG